MMLDVCTFLGVSLVSFLLNIICRAEGGTGTYSYMYVTSDVTWTFPQILKIAGRRIARGTRSTSN